ncbi:MAG: CRISPR-associated helicase Cas3' [Mariniphaga sp.]|nr:CRISPR-associated helicase Cas3' [Mariniphaga sp.]
METKIWGKSKLEDKEIPLAQHINDVLEVFEYLSPKVKSENLRELIKIVIEYHDAGKVLPYFQLKTLGNVGYEPFEVYTNIPHSLLSALLVDIQLLEEQLTVLFEDKQTAETYTKYILSAIAYHHWRDNFYDLVEGHTDVFERLNKLMSNEKKWNQIKENLKQVYSEINKNGSIKPLINKKWLDGLNNGIRFADYIVPPYQLYRMPQRIEMESSTLKDWVLISGFTMLSDHFASYVESDAEEKITSSSVEIQGPKYEEIKSKVIAELKEKLKEKYIESEIWQFQYVDQFKESNTILLAPTGIGKTEFSYLWSNGVKFFYTLPLRTAVNQIFRRTEKIFGKDKAGILHSDADVYILGDGGESESMRIYELARQLSTPAIVSTGDQFFPYALRPPAYEKIFAKFSYSRLIIDEVQAYDPKAAAIVVKFIEHVVQMGGKFLLMTATLPEFIRKEIEKRLDKVELKTLNLFEEDIELGKFSKHRIQLNIEDYKQDQHSYTNDTIKAIVDKSRDDGGNRILVVLNTVKQAQAIFDDIRKSASPEIEVKLFHSRYTQSHRKEIENELQAFIGNNDNSRKDKRPKILVATQIVEASLDLDADYLYTELAPWDSLIQRMGRVFREYRNTSPNAIDMISRRYHQKEIPENVFILVYNGKNKKGKDVFESSQGYVYNIELLRTTLKLIENGSIKIDDLKKWNNGNKVEIKLSAIAPKSLLLTESNKSELVDKLFAGLPDKSSYLKNFYAMLQILDAGFMSDRKSDAQKVFREINDVNVIAKNQKGEFISDLQEFNFGQKYAYTKFKKDILSKYLISVQISKVKEYIYESNLVFNTIKISDEITETHKLLKLKNWLYGAYFVDLEYSDSGGLIGVKEMSSYEIF